MSGLATFLDLFSQGDWTEWVGWTLFHSIWQIFAIAGIYAAAALALRNRSASSRYVAGCAAMAAMVTVPLLTYVWVSRDTERQVPPRAVAATVPRTELSSPARSTPQPTQVNSTETELSPAPRAPITAMQHTAPNTGSTVSADLSTALRPYLRSATLVWLFGVLLFSLRPAWGWRHVRRLRRHGLVPLPDSVQRLCTDLTTRLGVHQPVRVAQSALVIVPTIVGHLRPLVLLPASAVTGLNLSQLELILVHELAHVRRHDYLVNLAQTVVEALFFYHPAMWWVSSRIRCERENCCDDSAVAFSGSRATYVEALARLEEQRWTVPAAVMAASDGSLLNRVRRLCGQPSRTLRYHNAAAVFVGLATIGMVVAAFALQMPVAVTDHTKSENPVAVSETVQERMPGGTDSLADIPELADLRLGMTEAELRQIIKQNDLAVLTSDGNHGRTMDYMLTTSSGKRVIARLRDGECFAIERAPDLSASRDATVIGPDGRGLADVEVKAFVWPERLVLETQTDANGHFLLPDSRPGQWPLLRGKRGYMLTFSKPGFLPWKKHVFVERSSQGIYSRHSFLMRKAASLSGTLLDAEGNPLGGAQIRLCNFTAEPESMQESAPLYVTTRPIQTSRYATTRPDGSFRFENILPGRHLVQYEGMIVEPEIAKPFPRATVAHAETSDTEDGNLSVDDIVLDLSQSTASLEAEVVDENGKPLVNAEVSLHWESVLVEGVGFSTGLHHEQYPPAKTDAQGRMTISGIPPGEFEVLVEWNDEGVGKRKSLGRLYFEHNQPIKTRLALAKPVPRDILWGDAVDGIRLGIRPAPFAKSGSRLRHGDWLRYEVWIKNEGDQPIHIPGARNYGEMYSPRLENEAVNVVGHNTWHRLGISQTELDKTVLSVGPRYAKMLRQPQCSVRPEGTRRGRFGPEPLRVAPGKYPCFAELDVHYQEGLFYSRSQQEGKKVHLRSGKTEIQVLPAARLQVRRVTVATAETKREVVDANPDSELIRWSPSPSVTEDLILHHGYEPLLDEDDILDAIATPSLDDAQRYDVRLQLTPAASRRLARSAQDLQGERVVLRFEGFWTSPKITREVSDDRFVISDNLTKEQAEDIVQAIRRRLPDNEGQHDASDKDGAASAESLPVKHTPNAFFTARVIDTDTGRPIEKFTALAGTSRIEDIGWQWQPHTIREFSEGQMQWPPPGRRGYKEQVLRIEAEGYAPYQTPVVKRLDRVEPPGSTAKEEELDSGEIPTALSGRPGEPAELTIRLQRDPTVHGRVVLPNGQPAIDAQVAIAMASRQVRIIDGKIAVRPVTEDASLRDHWTRPFTTTTDEDGRFRLPTEIAPAAVIITHAQGITAFGYADLLDSHDISLQPWGVIDGQVMWGTEPGDGVTIDIGARTQVADRFPSLVGSHQSVQTDDRGRFRVEKLPPGLAQVSHVIEVPGKEGKSYRSVQFVEIAPGRPTELVFGGRGRPVVGKLVGADRYEDVRIRIAPNAPRAGGLADPNDVTWPAYGQFLKSPAGKNYLKNNILPEADGTFRIEDVPPETYQLFVTATGADGHIGYTRFTIDTVPGGASDEPHDLGDIRLRQ